MIETAIVIISDAQMSYQGLASGYCSSKPTSCRKADMIGSHSVRMLLQRHIFTTPIISSHNRLIRLPTRAAESSQSRQNDSLKDGMRAVGSVVAFHLEKKETKGSRTQSRGKRAASMPPKRHFTTTFTHRSLWGQWYCHDVHPTLVTWIPSVNYYNRRDDIRR